MIKGLKIISFLLIVSAVGFLYNVVYKSSHNTYFSNFFIENIRHVLFNINLTSAHKSITPSAGTTTTETPEDILRRGDSIIFLETSDRMHLPSLVLCALESAARVYPDRHVFFFMKGINHTASQDNEEVILRHYPTLSSLNNIHIVPLIMEDIFNSTPLFPWYKKINATKEPHWIHVSADGCRLALIWKYGGIYMDTDIISIYPIPHYDFLAGESNKYSSNGVYGFPAQHNFTWTCMEDFVQNYNGNAWGYQGPYLFTRVLNKLCVLPDFKDAEDITCGNITFLNPKRFYPISYPAWRQYYDVWNNIPAFNESYALHLWNYMNRDHKTMVPGSNTLVEHLYLQHCPSTYSALQKNESIYV